MLNGERVVLREWREADLEALAALRNDVGMQRLLMATARPNSVERVREWLIERGSQEHIVFFVVADSADNAVGYIQVNNIDRFHGRGDLGICLASSAHGRGIAAEACHLLEGYLRDTLALNKLYLQVLSDNKRAIAFYRKYGYSEVGILRQHFREGSARHDVILMERVLAP